MKDEISWPRAILLDFYGTVVEEDGEPIAHVCHEIVKASSRAATSEEVSSYWGRIFNGMCFESHGSTFRCERELEQESLEMVLRHFGAHLSSEALTQALYDYWTRPAMFPESRDVLAKCSIPVCLVSNIDNADLDSALRYNGLLFNRIVTSEDCRAYKPRPAMFEKALSLLDLTGAEVLHVGDSLSSDVRGARAMGIPVLWVNRKGRELPAGYEPPDYVSTDLTGILNILNPL
jgi:2-haloacid dehalogenase/putative hydrolase of the HAD superfamily